MKRIPVHFRRFAVVILLALLATPVLAQGPPDQGPPCDHFRGADRPMHERVFAQLDLTDDQREEVEQLMTDHRTAMQERREQMRARRTEMRDLIQADEFDEAAIRNAATAIAEVETEMVVERARLRHEIHKVLTPEQQEKAAEMMEKRREFERQHRPDFRGGRHFHGGHHRHGPMPDFDND